MLWCVALACVDVARLGTQDALDAFDQFSTRPSCCDTAWSLRFWMFICQLAYIGLLWLGFVWLVGTRSTSTESGGGQGSPRPCSEKQQQHLTAFFYGPPPRTYIAAIVTTVVWLVGVLGLTWLLSLNTASAMSADAVDLAIGDVRNASASYAAGVSLSVSQWNETIRTPVIDLMVTTLPALER